MENIKLEEISFSDITEKSSLTATVNDDIDEFIFSDEGINIQK